MYLSVRRRIRRREPGTDDTTSAFTAVVEAAGAENLIEADDWTGITVDIPVAYWRKANQIHQWFVMNVQSGVDECEEHTVSRERLQELVNVCTEVLDDHSKASALLPTQSGFFFGSVEYDVWYFRDLEYTKEQLTKLIEATSDWDEFRYQSSW